MSDKPLPPTDKRLRDARAQGNVPRSEVFSGFVAMVLATEAAFALAGIGIDRWLRLLGAAFARLGDPDRIEACLRLVSYCAGFIGVVIGLFSLLALIAALLAARICGTLVFAPKATKPSFNRLNAVRHVKALCGAKNLTAVALALATTGAVGSASYALLRERLALIDAMVEWQSLAFDLRVGITSLHAFVRSLLATLFVPAVLSVAIAKRQHRRSLRMTHRDFTDELKQTTGDPNTRARQRVSFTEAVLATPPVHREGGRRALITNPEHIAVLLHYDGDETKPPILLDKAIGDGAMQMADEALAEGVPVFRFRRLARHLYHHGELQDAIPADCYRAVAVVYRIAEEIEALSDLPNTPIEIDDAAFEA